MCSEKVPGRIPHPVYNEGDEKNEKGLFSDVGGLGVYTQIYIGGVYPVATILIVNKTAMTSDRPASNQENEY